MRNIVAIFRKELRGYFLSPLIYMIAAAFLALCGYYFYTDLLHFVTFGFGLNIMENFWQLLFLDIRKFLLFCVPFVTMRLFAEEKRLGTIELLLTYPLRDGEILLGKFCAAVVVVTALIVPTMLYPLYLYNVQPYPLLPVLSGYLGLLLLAVSFVACGMFISALTDSQVVAGVVTGGILFGLWALSWNEAALNPETLQFVRGLSMFDHFHGFAIGIIDFRDVAYFVFTVLLFVHLTFRVLESRMWRGRR
jgi:ABC-2 type transport system permease protein